MARTSAFGRGGMTTKLEAAQAAARCGAPTVLCNGRESATCCCGSPPATRWARSVTKRATGLGKPQALARLHDPHPTASSYSTPERSARSSRGSGKSLLPAGVAEVRGRFRIGDPVCLRRFEVTDASRGPRTRCLRVGGHCELIARRNRHDRSAQVLGYSNGDEVIHRDDLVLLEDSSE